ncbi:hypothetical protein BH23THE1_BH23THE1_19840 [soil metagenome]
MKLTNYSIKLSVVITFAVVYSTVMTGLVPQAEATISVDFNLDELTGLPGLELLRGPPGPQGETGPPGPEKSLDTILFQKP